MNKLLIKTVQENVPMNLTARIKGDLGNDFVSEDEKVSPAQITKDLEITNQDDNIISEDETKMDLPAEILEDLENTNQDDYAISDYETKKDLPSWIMGDLANMDQDDYFVTEDESERRILLILKILSTLLLIVCSILAVKCFEYSSFSVKRKIIYSSNGKYSRTKSLNIIKIYLSFIYQFFRYILFWTYSASFGFSDGKWFSVEYKVK